MPRCRDWFSSSRRTLLTMVSAVSLSFLVPANLHAADAAPAGKKVKILYLTQSMGFRHSPVTRNKDKDGKEDLALSEKVMIEIGAATGQFEVEPTQDAKIITPQKLKDIDVLMFYTTGPLPISDDNWKAVQDWVASGKGGFIGIHSATDTGWKYTGEGMDYTKFINGKFAGHPWGQGTPIKIAANDPSHPTIKSWGPSADHKDEIYQYSNYDPKAVRLLQSIDFESTQLKKPYLVPITWVRDIGKGRLFYSNIGHTPETWKDPRFREMIVDAVKWVTHQTDGSAEPNPDVQAIWTIHSFLAYGPDGKGPDAGSPSATQIAGHLLTADKTWLMETAQKITEMRGAAPPDNREPRAPNPSDEKKDAKKYADDVAKYEKELAKYKADQPKVLEAIEKFNNARKTLTEEITKKAAMPTAAAK